jgi:diguanylate cyclase (GGDEF)-like protein/PAS domain S-box-containing protein
VRPALKVYVSLVVAAAALLVTVDLTAVPTWPHPWSYVLMVVLFALAVGGEHLQFRIHSGRTTSAGTVPHMALAFLLPPGLAALVACAGMVVYVVNRRSAPIRAVFNIASVTLATGVAAHIASSLGGPDALRALMSDNAGWLGPPLAILATAVYHTLSASAVAGAVALDRRQSFWSLVRGRLMGVQSATEIGLGLIGAVLGGLLLAAPGWTPALLFPGVLVFLGKKAMDRADRRLRDLALTSAVGRAVAGTLKPEEAFRSITAREVRETLGLNGLALVPLGEPAQFPEHVACERDEPALRAILAQQVERDARRITVRADSKSNETGLPPALQRLGIAATAIPFGAGDETHIGVLVAWRGRPGSSPQSFSAEELMVLEMLADHAAVALETARLAREAAQAEARREADALQREALRQSEERFRSLVQNSSDVITVIDPDTTIRYQTPSVERVLGYAPTELVGTRLVDLLHPDDRPLALAFISRTVNQPGASSPVGWRVRHRDGSWLHVETIGNNLLQDPNVGAFVLTMRDVSERKALEVELRRQAFHDPLTGLPNRALLHDRLQQAIRLAHRDGSPLALLLMDLDRFKEVNDTLGHQQGDALLQQVCQRLQDALRASDTVARLGGDEFAVLLPGTDEAGATAVARQLLRVLEQPFELEGQPVDVGASLGFALHPAHGTDAATLLRRADVAMYVAKRAGGGYAVFSAEQDRHSPDRLALVGELRQAIEQNELTLHYQPKVSVGNGMVTGVEALVRWQHPERGLIPPDRFIPLAEQTGLIQPLTRWVLGAALRQCHMLRQAGLEIPVSVNLSMRNLHDPDLPAAIAELLARWGVPPAGLRVEVTESAVMADPGRALDVLGKLRALGLEIAIDDFGTGYSSLGYLKRLPVTQLKIDRSFVQHMATDGSDLAIVQATIAMGHNLGLTVVAEGVEDKFAWELLNRLGCDAAQGYYVSRPLPAQELLDWLRDSPWAVAPREQAA